MPQKKESSDMAATKPRDKEQAASVLVCECGGTIVSAQSGSGSVKFKCQKCKKSGSVKSCGVADMPVRISALNKAEQFAVFPGPPGERSGKGGKRTEDTAITRSFNLNGEGAEVVDSALDAWKKKTQISGKTWKAAALVHMAAGYLLSLTDDELERFGVEAHVIKRIRSIGDLQALRDSQLTITVGTGSDDDGDDGAEDDSDGGGNEEDNGDDDDEEPSSEQGISPADLLDDRTDKVNLVCEHAMRFVIDTGNVDADMLRAICSDGNVNSQAIKSLVTGGYLVQFGEKRSERPEAKGRRISIFKPTGKSYLEKV